MKKQEDAIRGMLEQSRNPHRIAETLGVKIGDVRQIMRSLDDSPPGWGRLELQPHIVSRREAMHPAWPKLDSDRLEHHRRLHDQGRVTMCQGRDGPFIIQYAMPNTPPVKRLPYFYNGGY